MKNFAKNICLIFSALAAVFFIGWVLILMLDTAKDLTGSSNAAILLVMSILGIVIAALITWAQQSCRPVDGAGE